MHGGTALQGAVLHGRAAWHGVLTTTNLGIGPFTATVGGGGGGCTTTCTTGDAPFVRYCSVTFPLIGLDPPFRPFLCSPRLANLLARFGVIRLCLRCLICTRCRGLPLFGPVVYTSPCLVCPFWRVLAGAWTITTGDPAAGEAWI